MKKIFDIKKMGALALGLVAFAPAASWLRTRLKHPSVLIS